MITTEVSGVKRWVGYVTTRCPVCGEVLATTISMPAGDKQAWRRLQGRARRQLRRAHEPWCGYEE